MNFRSLFLALLFFALIAGPAAATNLPGLFSWTIRVDCDNGGTVARALSFPAHRVVVRVNGVCEENVLINRNGVTLKGVGQDAALVGVPGADAPALALDGVSRIDVIDLAIRGGGSFGVTIRRNSEAYFERVAISDSPGIGLLVDQGSSAILVDSSSSNHQVFGAAVWGSSGLTVQGATEFSGNGQLGLLMSDGASLHTQGGGTLTASDNGGVGIALQSGAEGVFPSVVAQRNAFAGIQLTFSASFSSIGDANDISENGVFGIFMFDNAQLSLAATLRDNSASAIMASENSVVSLASDVPSVLSGSGVDVVLDGAIGTFAAFQAESMNLSFGSRVTFFPDSAVTALTCDPTVLVRGAVSCPAPAAALSGAPKNELVSLALDAARGARRLYRWPAN